LKQRLEQHAERQKRHLSDALEDAVRMYLREQDRAKIRREQDAYEKMHADLVRTHFGKWVAIHEGALVDVDDELAPLHRRVRARYGDEAVLLTQVEREPIKTLRLQTPSTFRIRCSTSSDSSWMGRA